jgi:hypothetical protein
VAAELRVYLLLRDLQRQFAAYLGTPTRARGYPPLEGDHALIVEVAPGLAIERVIDLALKSVPALTCAAAARRSSPASARRRPISCARACCSATRSRTSAISTR